MAKTVEQQDREIRELHAQIDSLKKAMSLMSRRLVLNERKAARISEIVRRQSDTISKLERFLRRE